MFDRVADKTQLVEPLPGRQGLQVKASLEQSFTQHTQVHQPWIVFLGRMEYLPPEKREQLLLHHVRKGCGRDVEQRLPDAGH